MATKMHSKIRGTGRTYSMLERALIAADENPGTRVVVVAANEQHRRGLCQEMEKIWGGMSIPSNLQTTTIDLNYSARRDGSSRPDDIRFMDHWTIEQLVDRIGARNGL